MSVQRRVDTRRSSRTARKRIEDALQALIGRSRGGRGRRYLDLFQSKYAWELFYQIHQGYEAKTLLGRSDNLGISWTPLAKVTIKKKLNKEGFYYAGGKRTAQRDITLERLGKANAELWKSQYRRFLGIGASRGLSGRRLVAEASKRAWAILEARGARPGAAVPILVNTLRLQNSVKPGHIPRWRYRKTNPDQIYETTDTSITIGTSVWYAKFHQQNGEASQNLGKLPPRPFIPKPNRMRPWTMQALRVANEALMNELADNVR